MGANKVAFFTIAVILLSGLVSADNENFIIGSITIKTTAEYQNGAATMKILVTSLNTDCDLKCSWSTPDDAGGPFFWHLKKKRF